MNSTVDDIKYELALAYRILANEGVLDTFGHKRGQQIPRRTPSTISYHGHVHQNSSNLMT